MTVVVAYTPTTWPGARLPHVWLDADTSIFDRLGDGFTLIRVGDNGPTGEAIIDATNVPCPSQSDNPSPSPITR